MDHDILMFYIRHKNLEHNKLINTYKPTSKREQT